MRTLRTLMLTAVVAAFVSPGLAADDDAAAAKKRAKDQIGYFNRDVKKAKDDGRFGDLVNELAMTKHPLVVKRIGKILTKSKSPDRRMIAATLLGRRFKKPEECRLEAGKQLLAGLKAKKMPNEVLENLVIAVGDVKYTPAVPVLNNMLLKGGDPWLLVWTVIVSGKLKDLRSLPALLQLWERDPVGYDWETGEVSVDTGASGNADQMAAEAAWQAQYGNAGAGGAPPVMLKVYIKHIAEAVEKITKAQIATAAELREWMEQNAEMLEEHGVGIPRFIGPRAKKKDKDDDDDGKGKGKGDK